ncbi:porin [uncultured Hydrogenophaga sp.]|uniref:porin n=1 Tax=uncultured Hydrogenophaga sp. TaxID=199683 RepID=UPI00265FBC51|nr:porin [uncultured Hydrogenophaga sp.]
MNSKQLVAAAAMALSGAAMAQSSVTVYGRLDASIGSAKVGNITNGVGPAGVTQMFSNNITTSRIGFRGTEDLGGGLSGLFIVETAFSPDAPGNTSLGDRAAVVGLSGGFGTIKLGRHDTSFDDIRDLMVSSNLWDSGSLASTETVLSTGAGATATNGVGGLQDYGDRASNQIRYESPSFSGFTFGVSQAFDENNATNRDVTAFNVRYKAGNLDVGVAYQENSQQSVAPVSPATTIVTNAIDYTTVAGAYNFGSFRVSGGWNQAKQKEVASPVKANTYTVGVNVPVDAWDFSLGYSTGKSKQNGATTEKGSAFSAGVTYSLSKRTRLYSALTNGDIKNAAGTKLRQRDIYALGLIHTF